jgi:hypothetical protein
MGGWEVLRVARAVCAQMTLVSTHDVLGKGAVGAERWGGTGHGKARRGYESATDAQRTRKRNSRAHNTNQTAQAQAGGTHRKVGVQSERHKLHTSRALLQPTGALHNCSAHADRQAGRPQAGGQEGRPCTGTSCSVSSGLAIICSSQTAGETAPTAAATLKISRGSAEDCAGSSSACCGLPAGATP